MQIFPFLLEGQYCQAMPEVQAILADAFFGQPLHIGPDPRESTQKYRLKQSNRIKRDAIPGCPGPIETVKWSEDGILCRRPE